MAGCPPSPGLLTTPRETQAEAQTAAADRSGIMQGRSCMSRESSGRPAYGMVRRSVAKKKNPHAVALGKKGGKKGGKARWAGVSPQERSEILRRASEARWKNAGR